MKSIYREFRQHIGAIGGVTRNRESAIAQQAQKGKSYASLTPQEAGRLGGLKGGHSRSAKKLAACRKNGFQRSTPHTMAERCLPQQPASPSRVIITPRPAVLIPAPPKEGQQ